MEKKSFFVMLLALAPCMTFTQVAINTSGDLPHSSAMLDVQATNKGMLAPRVALSASNLASPISSAPATGLLIYNTATAGAGSNAVFPGYYFWNGSSWYRTLTNTGSAFTSFTIPFWTSGGDLNACSSFYWDNVNSRLGLGTSTPGHQLEITQSLKLPVSISSTTGVIYKGSSWFIHNYEDAGTDGENTFMGELAGNFTLQGYYAYEASNNTAIGSHSLYVLSNGSGNTATGSTTLRWNTEGTNNSATGVEALYENSTGNYNTALGAYSLRYTETGSYNTAVGSLAGYGSSNNSISNNSFFGYAAGQNVTTGSNNILVGYRTGDNLTSGNNNIIIGHDLNVPVATSNNQVVIGASELFYGDLTSNRIGIGTTAPGSQLHIEHNDDAVIILDADANNSDEEDNPRFEMRQDGELVIGALGITGSNASVYPSSIGNSVYLMNEYNASIHFGTDGGIVMTITDDSLIGIRTTAPTVSLDVNGNGRFRSVGSGSYFAALNLTSTGTLTTTSSDARLKTNIEDIDNGLERIMQLRGVKFNWIDNPDGKKMIGFIAQEVELIVPELVYMNETDGYLGVNYAEMTAILVEAVKQQQEIIKSLQEENEKLLINQRNLEVRMSNIEESGNFSRLNGAP